MPRASLKHHSAADDQFVAYILMYRMCEANTKQTLSI